MELRNDQGPLFENYMINEINKQNEYLQIYGNMYFWRTSDQKEVDLILEKTACFMRLNLSGVPPKNQI